MITYNFIVGHGYVEDSMGAKAIVNFWTEEKDHEKAVQEFLKIIVDTFGDCRDSIQEFFYHFFRSTADGLGPMWGLEFVDNIDLWGTIQNGPLIELEGMNHFFDDRKKDNWQLSHCNFEYKGNITLIKFDKDKIDTESIYDNIFPVEEDEEEVVVTESDRMFPESMPIKYNVVFWKIVANFIIKKLKE